MNKYKKLLGNSVILTLGNFGSRFITFFMVPLYTAVLTTSEYGFVDILNTTINLMLPVISLELGQAIIRFSISENTKKNHSIIFSNAVTFTFLVISISIIVFPVLNYFGIMGSYTSHFVILLILKFISNLLSSYARGIGKVSVFAINGIITTISTVGSNLFLLLFLNMGVEGYIDSMIIASLTSCIYLFISVKGYELLKNFSIQISSFKAMLKFSLPLIPNSIMWWLVNGATRYFILFFVGTSGNGLFAVANKIPTIISTFQVIFSQAWQLSSFEEYDSDDRETYYSDVFAMYVACMFIGGSLLLIVNRPLMSVFASESFSESWKFVPLLVLGVIFQSLSNFLGMIYTAAGATTKAFTTSIYGGISSILANIIFVPIFGTFGASIAISISFFTMFITRIFDTRKYVKISVERFQLIFSIFLYLIQVVWAFVSEGMWMYVGQIILFLLMLSINKKVLVKISKMIFSLIKSFLKR